jgi:hypothetical protein
MLRTLIAGALIGFAGKKLYESGALNEFASDLKTRLNDAKLKTSLNGAQPAAAPVGAPKAPSVT